MTQSIPPVEEADLRPFVSFLILVSEAEKPSLEPIEGFLKHRATRQGARLLADGLSRPSQLAKKFSQLDEVRVFVCQRSRPPAWGPESDFRTNVPVLFILARHQDIIAVGVSAENARDALARAVDRDTLTALQRIAPEILETAFMQGDIARFWMAPGHQPRRNRPRSKSTSGTHLQESLGPGDQGYVLSAAQSDVDPEHAIGNARRVGVGLRGSTVWTQRASSWNEFLLAVEGLLTAVRTVARSSQFEQRFQVFAKRAVDLSSASGAYDIEFDEPLLPPEADDATEVRELQDFLVSSVIAVQSGNGRAAHLVIGPNGAEAAVVSVTPNMIRSRISFDFGIIRASDQLFVPHFRKAFEASNPTIFYNSGHIVNRDGPFEEHFGDIPFNGWQFEDFSGFTISTEKPGTTEKPISDLSASDPGLSLFGWVIHTFTNEWLYCDDRSNELADFVALSADGTIEVLHVKAAGAGMNPRISTGVFHEVCAQVQKNAASLSVPRLIEVLTDRVNRRTAGPLWRHGQRSDEFTRFLEALGDRPASAHFHAKIIQPHVSDLVIDEGRRKASVGPDVSGMNEAARLRRLEQLLNDTAASVAATGATLTVVGRISRPNEP